MALLKPVALTDGRTLANGFPRMNFLGHIEVIGVVGVLVYPGISFLGYIEALRPRRFRHPFGWLSKECILG